MSAALDKEIKYINKMCLPAATRSDFVKRAKAIAACLAKGPAETEEWLDETWCKRCGFNMDDHKSLESKLKHE